MKEEMDKDELLEPGTWQYEMHQEFIRNEYGESEYDQEDEDMFRLLMDF